MMKEGTQVEMNLLETPPSVTDDVLLKVTDLKKHFPVGVKLFSPPQMLKAVDGVSFSVHTGETVGIVGESGSGKSTTAKLIIRLYDPTNGSVELQGRDLAKLSRRDLRGARRDVQMVFQDPYASLNPKWSIERTLMEPMKAFGLYSPKERKDRVRDLLSNVGLDDSSNSKYPHQFSGGQRQRIGIARALALNPKLIIADEPVSALDISVQAQVINLLQDLQERFQLTYIFISHDLSVVEHISTRVLVMYLGRIVEFAPTQGLFAEPLHPYTQALLSSAPRVDGTVRDRIILHGDIPSPLNPPMGCAFHTRCPQVMDICKATVPTLKAVQPGHQVACHLY
jgi:oligopeptide transport system ATP-binding protein